MVKQRDGVIINISSGAGKTAYAGYTVYSATKFAVLGFTQGFAQEVVGQGVRVYAVCPGVTQTQMSGFSGMPPEKVAKRILAVAEYNYSISYPSNAVFVPESDFKIFIQGDGYPFGSYVAVDILDNSNNLPLAQVGNESFTTDAAEAYDLGWRQSNFLGRKILTTQYVPPGDMGMQTIYLFEERGIIYALWKAPVDNASSTKFNDLSDQILPTFQFLE